MHLLKFDVFKFSLQKTGYFWNIGMSTKLDHVYPFIYLHVELEPRKPKTTETLFTVRTA